MNLPPKHKDTQSLARDAGNVTDIAAARSATEIERIAAIVDQHRGVREESGLSDRHDTTRNALTAKRMLEISRHADAIFDSPLLSNPGWDILLDLFIQRCEGKSISIISVCIAANAPTSTVLRYLQAMMDSGTVVKRPSQEESDGHLVELSDLAFTRMNTVLS